MCGRAIVFSPDGTIDLGEFTYIFTPTMLRRRYNLNPREEIPVGYIDPNTERRVLRLMHWNLIPNHLTSRDAVATFDAKYSTFNARVETAATAATFQMPWRRQRCLVIVDGMIEWLGAKGRKVPHWIRPRDGKPFAMAGLWDQWIDRQTRDELWSTTVVVGPPSEWFRSYHHRMARILRPDAYDAWLDPKLVEAKQVQILLEQSVIHDDKLIATPISRKVNNPRYDKPDCLDPAA